MKTLTFAALAALMPVAALAHDGMHANDAYARSTNPMVGAVFLELENHRAVECTLIAATSDAAARVELHTHREEGGVMKMVEIEGGITVPAGATHPMARGGDHIMLMGLTDPLVEGETVELTLDFGDCGQETVQAVVDNKRAAMGADAAPASKGDHANH